MTRALLLDLDDTLYDYQPAEQRARKVTLDAVVRDTGRSPNEVGELYDRARKQVKARVGDTGASHSRLLYLLELGSQLGALAQVRSWERTFWSAYMDGAQLRDGARPLLEAWRARGNKTAIVTDLTADVQLMKLEAFGLFPLIDAVAVSEEVLHDKPARQPFELAMQRLGVTPEQCVMVGDNATKDGAGATALGMPYYQVRGTEAGAERGLSLVEVARALGVSLEEAEC
jgi:putative hydrolase of the HAD superfamily